MDIKEIKSLINTSTAVLVLDNGEPSFVVLGYEMYKDLVANKTGEKEIKISQSAQQNGMPSTHYLERETEILDRLNKEILALKTQIETEEKNLNNQGIDPVKSFEDHGV